VRTKPCLLLFGAAWLAACASSPPPAASASAEARTNKPVWTVPTEEETRTALDQKFHDAAKGYVKLKKDGVLLFCKKQREIGSNIATLQCITEAQLRNQVETMEDYRQRRRDAAKCTHGPGCSAGF
jgi:type IV pilus biogenesis protein CpaD/CtpE